MKDNERTTRRTFIKTAAAATLATGLTGCVSGSARKMGVAGAGHAPRSEKLRIAYIGTGGIGGWHLRETAELGVVCPCFCDVDTKQMKAAAEQFPNAQRYQDYREMFDKEHKNFDAVMVGTPDHHHFLATMIAMQLGKHVYTQKPLTHTPWEARQLTEAAKKYKVATQMGNPGARARGVAAGV